MVARQVWARMNCAIHKDTKELSLLTDDEMHAGNDLI